MSRPPVVAGEFYPILPVAEDDTGGRVAGFARIVSSVRYQDKVWNLYRQIVLHSLAQVLDSWFIWVGCPHENCGVGHDAVSKLIAYGGQTPKRAIVERGLLSGRDRKIVNEKGDDENAGRNCREGDGRVEPQLRFF